MKLSSMHLNDGLRSFCPHRHKQRNNNLELVGSVIKKLEFLGPSRDAQNVCAIVKGGTVINLLCVVPFIEDTYTGTRLSFCQHSLN